MGKREKEAEPHSPNDTSPKMPKIVLFDVDGTLSEPRKKSTQEMRTFLQELRKILPVGIVGGSDLKKIKEQLGDDAETAYDYLFSENGLVAHKAGELLATQSLRKHLGEDKLKAFINFTLKEIAEIDIPVKRGTFIEFRNCSQEERDAFEAYDKVHGIRKDLVAKLKEKFADFGLAFSVGGQISFDVFPNGWDETFCLQFVEKDFDEIHFFGDKTYPGGNDYEIFESAKTVGHTTTGPEDTIRQCK